MTAKPRLRRWALVAALVLMVWAGAQAGTALVVTLDVGPPDALVMLASHETERLPATAALARQYPHAVVLLTVPREVTKFTCERCPERVAWLATEGVPGERVVVLPHLVKNTHEEAVAVHEYTAAHAMQRIVVVTSPYHTRRALGTFRSAFAGAAVQVGVAPATAWSPAHPAAWPLRRYDRGYVAYEWAAVVYYWLRFGVRP